MNLKNYYSLLKIDQDATESDIKKAYRKLAIAFHPDVNTDEDAEDKFKEIGEAYAVLGDSQKRQIYDQTGTTDFTGFGSMSNRSFRGRGMGRGFRGRGYAPELSEEEWKKLDEQRNTFFEATDDLRQKSYSKGLELQSELAKKNPDTGKAAGLQKELSNLRSQIDQKRIGHLIEMRKINPNAGSGFAGRGGRGFMRSGPAFGGPCWR